MSINKSPWRKRLEEKSGSGPYGRGVSAKAAVVVEGAPAKTPWGRDVTLAETAPAQEKPAPVAADFAAVGLSEAAAIGAAEGLAEGKFLSFEDACLSQALFAQSTGRPAELDEDLMRSKARYYAQGGPA